jgi:hypothetical protein
MTKLKGRRSRKDAEEFLVNVELYVSAATILSHKVGILLRILATYIERPW